MSNTSSISSTADGSGPLSFEGFSASRRRQQSTADTRAAQSASQAAANIVGLPQAAVMAANAKSPQYDAFKQTFGFQRLFLAVILIEWISAALEVTQSGLSSGVEAHAADPSASPTFPRLVVPGFRLIRSINWYLAAGLWLISFAEATINAAASIEKKNASILRLLDAFVMLVSGALFAMKAPAFLRLLVLLGRFVRIADIMEMANNEINSRTLRLDARYVEERNRNELLAAQVEQLQGKLVRESENRRQIEEGMLQLKISNEELTEALELAAQDMAEIESQHRQFLALGGGGGGGGGGKLSSKSSVISGGAGAIPTANNNVNNQIRSKAPVLLSGSSLQQRERIQNSADVDKEKGKEEEDGVGIEAEDDLLFQDAIEDQTESISTRGGRISKNMGGDAMSVASSSRLSIGSSASSNKNRVLIRGDGSAVVDGLGKRR